MWWWVAPSGEEVTEELEYVLGRFIVCGANDEFFLAATAQNLRKLAKHCPAGYWLSQRARGIFPAPQQTTKVR